MEQKRFGAYNLIKILSSLMAVVVIVLVVASFFVSKTSPGINSKNFQRISDKVTYKNPDNETSTISLPCHISLRPGEEAMYYFRVPEGSVSRDYLFVYVDELDTAIYAGNQFIGNYLGAGKYKFGGDIPSEWYVMQFSKNYEYSNIYVRIKAGPNGYSGILKNVYVGDKSAVILELVRQEIPTIIVYITLFVFGVIICIRYFTSFFRKVENTGKYFALSMGLLFLAFNYFLRSDIRQLFTGNIPAAQTIARMSLACGAVGFISYLLMMGKRLKKKNVFIPLLCFAASFFFDGLFYYAVSYRAQHIILMIGTIILVTGLSLDIRDALREKRESEAMALEYNRERTQFLGRISHAIRTPVNAIQGMNSVIMRETRNPAMKQHSRNIKSSIESLLSIIDDILDVSRIESGKIEILDSPYDFMSLVNDLNNITSLSAGEKGLSFSINNDPNIPARLTGDEIRVRQVILNLLSNALKYTKEGSISLSFGFEKTGENAIDLKITVSDTGEGIKPEDMAHLFDTYERLNEKSNSNIEGTGLGLPITKNLVTLMNGSIACESTYGKGTSFIVTIPQGTDDESTIGSFREREEAASADNDPSAWFLAPSAKVLVVDDVDMNLDVMRALFEPSKMTVDTAGGGEEFLKLITEKKYDIIFLDHMMPSPDGVEAFRKMKTMKDNKNPDTPVIMLTANAVIGAREAYLEMGFTDYLSKPVSEKELINMCRQYLDSSLLSEAVQTAPAKADESQNEDGYKEIFDTLSSFLNTESGLSYSMGKKDFYLNSLKSFSKNGQIELMKDAYEKKDMPEYKIHVHALKGVARLIGADDLSAKAKALEDASGQGDLSFVEAHHDNIISDFNELSESITMVLESTEEKSSGNDFSKADFSEALTLLSNCAKDIDIDGMDEAAKLLKSFNVPDDIKEKFDQLLHEEAEIHFDEVIRLSDELIALVK